ASSTLSKGVPPLSSSAGAPLPPFINIAQPDSERPATAAHSTELRIRPKEAPEGATLSQRRAALLEPQLYWNASLRANRPDNLGEGRPERQTPECPAGTEGLGSAQGT